MLTRAAGLTAACTGAFLTGLTIGALTRHPLHRLEQAASALAGLELLLNPHRNRKVLIP